MKKAKIYIAAPVSLDWSTVLKFRNKLLSSATSVNLWERDGRYSDNWLGDADAVVFLLPNLKWECAFNELPIGLKRELTRAQYLNKKIFIGYKTFSGEIKFYDANVITRNGSLISIEGVAGSYESFKKHVINISKDDSTNTWSNPCVEIKLEKPKKMEDSSGSMTITLFKNPGFDERILLMLC